MSCVCAHVGVQDWVCKIECMLPLSLFLTLALPLQFSSFAILSGVVRHSHPLHSLPYSHSLDMQSLSPVGCPASPSIKLRNPQQGRLFDLGCSRHSPTLRSWSHPCGTHYDFLLEKKSVNGTSLPAKVEAKCHNYFSPVAN